MRSARHSFTPLELAATGISLAIASFLVIDPVVYGAVREFGTGTYNFFRSFTHLGRTNWILIPAGSAILVLGWMRARETGFRSRVVMGYASQLLVFVFAAISLSGLAASLAKNVIGRARPKLFTTHGPMEFQPMTFDADFASFPSGHATTAGALAAVLAVLFPRWRVLIFIAGAGLPRPGSSLAPIMPATWSSVSSSAPSSSTCCATGSPGATGCSRYAAMEPSPCVDAS